MSPSANSRSDIASRIHELRDSSGSPLAEIAARLGLDPARLAAYESGALDIPIGVLYELAGLFKIDLTDLLTGQSPNLQRFCVVREGKGPEIERFPGYRFQSLAFGFANRHFEPLLVNLDPANNLQISLVTHSGQEFNLVLSGRVRVIIGGQAVDLAKGDSLFFDPSLPHGQLALDESPASFLTVIEHS